MKKYEQILVEIDEETIKKFESIPRSKKEKSNWPEYKDALLLKYWPIKRHKDVADFLGYPVNTAKDRYEKLIRENRE